MTSRIFMKTLFTILSMSLLVILASHTLSIAGSVSDESGGLTAQIAQAKSTGDVKQILSLLPEVEKRVSRDTAYYYRVMDDIVTFLGTNDWKNLVGLYRAEVSPKRERLLECAQFVGAVRSQMIPNYHYTPRSMPKESLYLPMNMNPQAVKDPELKKEIERAWANWRHEQETFKLQSTLERIDTNFTSRLLQACRQYIDSHPKDADFVEKIASTAKLTPDEQKELVGKSIGNAP